MVFEGKNKENIFSLFRKLVLTFFLSYKGVVANETDNKIGWNIKKKEEVEREKKKRERERGNVDWVPHHFRNGRFKAR